MSYKSLYKLFDMDDNFTFNKINNDKFNSNSIIKLDLYINDNQTFFIIGYEKFNSKVRNLN